MQPAERVDLCVLFGRIIFQFLEPAPLMKERTMTTQNLCRGVGNTTGELPNYGLVRE